MNIGKIIILLPLLLIPIKLLAADDPCSGKSGMLSLVNRPTIADSACVVKFNNVIVESGYQYQFLQGGTYQQNYPELQLRIGLPWNNELSYLLPNHISQTVKPKHDSTASQLSLKHEIGYNEKWLGSVEAIVVLPDGGQYFGSKHNGAFANAIVDYNLSKQITITLMAGVSSESQSAANGGKRFHSINPDLVLTYQPQDYINYYIEFYGKTHPDVDQGFAYNADLGIIYLPKPNVAIDAEYGHRIKGELDSFNSYIGVGLSLKFG